MSSVLQPSSHFCIILDKVKMLKNANIGIGIVWGTQCKLDMIYMSELKKKVRSRSFLWLLAVDFSSRVFVFTFIICLLLIETQSRSNIRKTKRKSCHLERASLNVTWPKSSISFGTKRVINHVVVQVVNHRAGFVSSCNLRRYPYNENLHY